MTLIAGLLLALPAGAAELSASVDRTVIGEDESLILTVRLNEQVGYGGPNFDQLKNNFEILNQQRSNQFRSVNGRTEGWTEWTIALAPKKTGELTIPGFDFQGAVSDAIEITVEEVSANTPVTDRDLFALVEVNKEQVYVQEELRVSVKVHSALDLREFGATNELSFDNAIVEEISQTGYRKRMNNKVYRVEEIVYAVYPQESGELTIPSLRWMAVVSERRNNSRSDPFFGGRGSVRRLSSQPKTINVAPKPTSYTGKDWLPARELSLDQHWSHSPDRFVVGEPITRSITIEAEGLTAAQLAPLPNPSQDGIKVYTDQPQFDQRKSADGITGKRIESRAIVPTRAGEMTLPPVTVDWWDTAAGRQRSASLPAQTIRVAPAAGGAATPSSTSAAGADNTAAEPRGSDEPTLAPQWVWGLVVSNTLVAVLAVVFFVAWQRSKQQFPSTPSSAPDNHGHHKARLNEAFQQLRRACSQGQPQAARQHLAEWGRHYWQLPHPPTLDEISQRAGSEALTKELEALDKILYGNVSREDWDGKPLWHAVVAVKQRDQKHEPGVVDGNKKTALPPLYPSTS